MRYLVFIMLMFASTAMSQDIRSTKNVFGGYNYYNRGKLEVSSRPNVFKGYNYEGKFTGYSRRNLQGGFDYKFRTNPELGRKYVPLFKEK